MDIAFPIFLFFLSLTGVLVSFACTAEIIKMFNKEEEHDWLLLAFMVFTIMVGLGFILLSGFIGNHIYTQGF